MLKTKSLTTTISAVPREWVFEHYLKLKVKLTGQDIRIKSPFNPEDKKPSFFVYYSNKYKKYLFKDFSMDYQGDGTELIMKMFSLTTRGEAAHKIIEDYTAYIRRNGKEQEGELKPEAKYKVAQFELRNWNVTDKKYWTRFHIGSKLLEKYNVKPLSSYIMRKENDEREVVMKGPRLYGYFRQDGTLYKIYQPTSKENKFIRVMSYIHGTDQLTYKAPYLIIASSLKDMMAIEMMGFTNAELVAPDSENVMIPKEVIASYKLKYKKICTLFDNDQAGIRSMQKYKEVYDIPGVHFQLEKDPADALEKHGIKTTRTMIYPLLTKALTGQAKTL